MARKKEVVIEKKKRKPFDFKGWYAQNKDTVSARRRERYKEDAQYRENKRKHSASYYWLKSRRAKSVGLNQVNFDTLELTPDLICSMPVTNEADIRYGMTLHVPMYYSSKVAAVLRRSSQTIRLWFMDKRIDDVFHRSSRQYRLFTKDQMHVIAELRYWLSFDVREFSQHPFFMLLNEKLQLLQPDGIVPMLKDEWRFDPTPCPFCNSTSEQGSLQHKVEGKWEYVQCFNCLDPYDLYGRERLKSFSIVGECPKCRNLLETVLKAADTSKLNVMCTRCGTRLETYDVIEQRI